jgi:hypothetical protein
LFYAPDKVSVENMAASDKMPIAPPSLSWLHTSTPHGLGILPSALDELLHPFHRQVFAHLDGGGQGSSSCGMESWKQDKQPMLSHH